MTSALNAEKKIFAPRLFIICKYEGCIVKHGLVTASLQGSARLDHFLRTTAYAQPIRIIACHAACASISITNRRYWDERVRYSVLLLPRMFDV